MNKAFSLIEVIIAIAILGGVSVVLSQSFFAISRANTKGELIKDMKQAGDFSIRVMEQMIRANTGIVSLCNGSPSKELTISNRDGYQTRFHCELQTINGRAVTRLASTSGSLREYLTPTNATMGGDSCNSSTLQITCTRSPGQSSLVRISFTLSQVQLSNSKFEEASVAFQTSIVARN